jgi:hypothetical protein
VKCAWREVSARSTPSPYHPQPFLSRCYSPRLSSSSRLGLCSDAAAINLHGQADYCVEDTLGGKLKRAEIHCLHSSSRLHFLRCSQTFTIEPTHAPTATNNMDKSRPQTKISKSAKTTHHSERKLRVPISSRKICRPYERPQPNRPDTPRPPRWASTSSDVQGAPQRLRRSKSEVWSSSTAKTFLQSLQDSCPTSTSQCKVGSVATSDSPDSPFLVPNLPLPRVACYSGNPKTSPADDRALSSPSLPYSSRSEVLGELFHTKCTLGKNSQAASKRSQHGLLPAIDDCP